MKTTHLALAAAGALLLALPAAQAFKLPNINIDKIADTAKDVAQVTKGVAGIGAEEERVIGGSVAIQIVSRYGGLVKDKTITERVNLIGKALASYSDRPDLQWRFGVLNSAEVNAFSAPSGYVFITRGLMELCADEDQLAAVLAHEIAHITQRHALKIVARGEFISGAHSLVSKRSSDVRQANAMLSQFDTGIDKIISTLCEQGFDPKTEFDADKRGDQLATLCGYKPCSLHGALASVKAAQGGAKEKVFSTHPSLDKRMDKLPH